MAQLSDLSAKISKGQAIVSHRRTNPDNLVLPPKKGQNDTESQLKDVLMTSPLAAGKKEPTEGKGKLSVIGGAKEEKPREDSALLKAVKDRYVVPMKCL